MRGDRLGQIVIGAGGYTFGLINIQKWLNPGRSQREDRHINACFVHMPDALFAQIKQPVDNLRCAF